MPSIPRTLDPGGGPSSLYDMITLISKHEVQHVTIPRAFLLIPYALPATRRVQITLIRSEYQNQCTRGEEGGRIVTRILRLRQLEQPSDGFPQYTMAEEANALGLIVRNGRIQACGEKLAACVMSRPWFERWRTELLNVFESQFAFLAVLTWLRK